MKDKINLKQIILIVFVLALCVTSLLIKKLIDKNNETTNNNEIVQENTDTKSDKINYTEEKNKDGSITKVTYEDGFTIYSWEYFRPYIEEAQEKANNDVFDYRLMDEEKLNLLTKEIIDMYQTTKERVLDNSGDMGQDVELYEKAAGLMLACDDANNVKYKVANGVKNFIKYRYGGYEGRYAEDELIGQLEEAISEFEQ